MHCSVMVTCCWQIACVFVSDWVLGWIWLWVGGSCMFCFWLNIRLNVIRDGVGGSCCRLQQLKWAFVNFYVTGGLFNEYLLVHLLYNYAGLSLFIAVFSFIKNQITSYVSCLTFHRSVLQIFSLFLLTIMLHGLSGLYLGHLRLQQLYVSLTWQEGLPLCCKKGLVDFCPMPINMGKIQQHFQAVFFIKGPIQCKFKQAFDIFYYLVHY